MLKLAFFGDGPWASLSLNRLLDKGYAPTCVVLRVRPTDPELARIANESGIPVYQPESVNARSFTDVIEEATPDLNISVSYDQILRKRIRNTSKLGFINFHAGKLPHYRGRNILNWALINGETEIGLTAHYVDDGIDTGDIILQRTIDVGWKDTYSDVLARTTETIPDLVEETIGLIESGQASRTAQVGHGTYYSSRGPGDEWLDWSDTSENLHNKVRAIGPPAPGAMTALQRQKVTILNAFFDPNWPKYMATPGQVVGKTNEGVFIKTGDSVLRVTRVEMSGGPEIPTWQVGTRLGENLPEYLRDLEARISDLEGRLDVPSNK